MKNSSLPIDIDSQHETPEISIILPESVLDFELKDSSEEDVQREFYGSPKNIRSKFYSNIQTNDRNWSTTYILCYKTQHDKNMIYIKNFQFFLIKSLTCDLT